MPLFDFTCSDCNETFEDIMRASETLSDIECPGCGSNRVEKSIGAPGQIRSSSQHSHPGSDWSESIGNRAAAARVSNWKDSSCC